MARPGRQCSAASTRARGPDVDYLTPTVFGHSGPKTVEKYMEFLRQELAKLVRGYWAQFARNGDPNSVSAPRWLAYDEGSPRYFEIGERVGVHVVAKRVEALDRIMRRVVGMQVDLR
jgi:para-nitrobenzyl esterase